MNVWGGISLPAWLLSKSFNCPLLPPSIYYPSPIKFMPICQHVKIMYGLTVLRLEGLDRSEMLLSLLVFLLPTGKYRTVNSFYWENKGCIIGSGTGCVRGKGF